MNIIKNLKFAALAVTLLSQTLIIRADAHGPQSITFSKCAGADGKLRGPVAGDCGVGTVVFTLLSAPWGAKVLHIAGEYAIDTADCSFNAICTGIADTRTGHIVLNGVVTAGAFLGARVQVRAQGNSDLSCSEGEMTITPSGQK